MLISFDNDSFELLSEATLYGNIFLMLQCKHNANLNNIIAPFYSFQGPECDDATIKTNNLDSSMEKTDS